MHEHLSGRNVEFSLARLLQPLSVETFLDEIWEATHYHIKRNCAGYFDGLLHGSSAIEELMEWVRPEPSAVRLIRRDEKRESDTYRLADGRLDIVRVRNDFDDGYTVKLAGVEQYVPAIASLSHSIEVELNFVTKVNAYITPPGSQGFLAHYDNQDVLILQIHGSKIWHLYDVDVPLRERECEQFVTAGLPSPTDLCLEVGDVLYLPRGKVHAAETTSEPSVHLTVGIFAPTLLALVTQALYSLSLRDDRVHSQLPPGHLDDADVRANVSLLVHDIVNALESSVIAESLGELEVLAKDGRRIPVGQTISNGAGIDDQTLVVKYRPRYSRVTADAGSASSGTALQFAQLVANATPDHKAPLAFISSSTEPFRVSDLPGLGAAQQKELARTLITSGYLVRLPDD